MAMRSRGEPNDKQSAICNLKSKIVVGLIGGIGSGKSSAAAALAKQGARLISGDVLGHEALQDAEIKRQVIERWGDRLLDRQGQIDRRRLGAIVFGNPEERKQLEAMVHPTIKHRLAEEIASAQADEGVKFIVVDAAVMVEACWSKHCDRIVYVDAPREVRLKRLAEQRKWTADEVAAREKAQMSLHEKKSLADAVLDNSGSAEQLQEEVQSLLKRWGIDSLNKENLDHG